MWYVVGAGTKKKYVGQIVSIFLHNPPVRRGGAKGETLLDVESSEEETGGCYYYKVDCITVYCTVYRWLTIQLRICQRQPRAVSGNDTWYVRRISPAHFHIAYVHGSENPCPIDRRIERRGKKRSKSRIAFRELATAVSNICILIRLKIHF